MSDPLADLALAPGPDGRGTRLPVRAHPGARRAGLLGTHDGALRVAVAAPPDGGRANAALLELLAEVLGSRRSDLSLEAGPASRRKRILVAGLDPDAVRGRLARALTTTAPRAPNEPK